MRRHLVVGVGLTVAAAAVAFSNATLNLQALWTLLVGAMLVLVPGRSLPGRLAAFVAGLIAAWGGFALRAAVLPDIPAGRALYAAIPILLVLVIAVVTAGRAPLWAGLAGLATFIGAYEAVFAASPTDFIEQSITTLTSVLVLVAIGALVTFALAARRVQEVFDEVEPELPAPPPPPLRVDAVGTDEAERPLTGSRSES